MKLFAKYNRINLLATIIIFLLSSTTFYVAIKYILVGQVDDDLTIEEREIKTYIKEHDTLPEPIPVKDQKITYSQTDELLKKRKFNTVHAFDPQDEERNSYRVLQFGVNANGKNYKATVAKSLEGTDELINSILLITSTTILVILIVSLTINRVLLKRLWKPFYQSLHAIKDFKLEKKQVLNFPSSTIDEFTFMNQIF